MSFGPEHKSTFAESIARMLNYSDSELGDLLASLPQGDLAFGGPVTNCNAYVCLKDGILQIYLKDGGWLGAPVSFLKADAAPWAD